MANILPMPEQSGFISTDPVIESRDKWAPKQEFSKKMVNDISYAVPDLVNGKPWKGKGIIDGEKTTTGLGFSYQPKVDTEYGVEQQAAYWPGARRYKFTHQPEGANGLPGLGQTAWGWASQKNLDEKGVKGHTGYAPVWYGSNNDNKPVLFKGNHYFTNGQSIRNTENPEHWRYKWFKQQAQDNEDKYDKDKDSLYDEFNRGLITRGERKKRRKELLEEYRMNERKWDYGMDEGGYDVPLHIRALQAVGLLSGY